MGFIKLANLLNQTPMKKKFKSNLKISQQKVSKLKDREKKNKRGQSTVSSICQTVSDDLHKQIIGIKYVGVRRESREKMGQ